MMNRDDAQLGSVADEISTVRLDANDKQLYIGTASVIGRRKSQQDAIKADTFYHYLEQNRAIAVLCDGMGGLNGGERASALCSTLVYDAFHCENPIPSIPAFFQAIIARADDEVCHLKNEDGVPIPNSGTTMVSVIVEDGCLFWGSVGDSRIYLVRGDQILCITKDHNYGMLLDERVKKGEITQAQADNDPKREALVSYMGMGGVRYIDMNVNPFRLMDGDRLVLCSDGLYRTVTQEEIWQTVCQSGIDAQQAAEALTALALSKNMPHQDNTSVIVLEFQDSGTYNI